jgi:hypothetical protein
VEAASLKDHGSPKEAPGAKFRFQVEMGAFDAGIQELRRALDTLKGDGGGFLVRRIIIWCERIATILQMRSVGH